MCHLTGKPQTPRPFKLPDPQKVQTPQLIITKIKGRADLRRSYNFIDSIFFAFQFGKNFAAAALATMKQVTTYLLENPLVHHQGCILTDLTMRILREKCRMRPWPHGGGRSMLLADPF